MNWHLSTKIYYYLLILISGLVSDNYLRLITLLSQWVNDFHRDHMGRLVILHPCEELQCTYIRSYTGKFIFPTKFLLFHF